MVASVVSKTLRIEPQNNTLKIDKLKRALPLGTRKVCFVLIESLAIEIVRNSSFKDFLTSALPKELKIFVKKPVHLISMIQTPTKIEG